MFILEVISESLFELAQFEVIGQTRENEDK